MLVLSKKCHEKVVIGGANGFNPGVTVTVLEVKGHAVRLGFKGDMKVPVHRWEIWQKMQDGLPDGVPALV